MQDVILRTAVEQDVPAIFELVRELAVFEKLERQLIATAADFREQLFGPHPAAEAIVAEQPGHGSDTVLVGMALFFRTFSTFNGKPGLWLEDLIVKEACRGQGVGRRLIERLAQIAVARGYLRLEWAVLDWNVKAIQFYRSLGALPQDEWTTYRLTGEPLTTLAARSLSS